MTIPLFFCLATSLAAAEPSPDGNLLVASAAEALVRHPGFEAKLRQQASLFGQLVAGAGWYVQSFNGEQLLVRFEFKVQVGNRSVSLLHVNDGSILWIRRDVDQVSSQAYVNLRRLREAANQDPPESPPKLDTKQLAIGGLGQLLLQVSKRFDFATPVATEIKGIPMWEVTGKWKPAELERLLPQRVAADQPVDLSQLPEHLPTWVKLTLGRDQKFPLFPYRFEFGRVVKSPPQGKTQNAPVVQPLITIELFEVGRRSNVSPELFKFPIGDQEVEDQTEKYLHE